MLSNFVKAKARAAMTGFLSSDRPIWIVAGAGISSAPPASIPVWGKMKTDTLKHAQSVLERNNIDAWGGASQDLVDAIAGAVATLLDFPEEAMEDLCLAYGDELTAHAIACVIERSGPLRAQPTAAHQAIAKLVGSRSVVGIITTNFDSLLERALSSEGAGFQVFLSGKVPSQPIPVPLLKVHGSIDVPGSMSFQRSRYYVGLSDRFASYLREAIRSSHLIILGYSGYDSDLFPLIRDVVADKSAANTVTIVNPALSLTGSPLGSLLGLDNVEHVRRTADQFFGGNPSATALGRDASVIPDESILPVTAFLALASRRAQPQTGHSMFWLLQDIADDSGDTFWRAIAHFGKSLCASNAQDLSDECLMGCSFFERVREANPASREQCQTFFNWMVCSLWELTRHVLALKTESEMPRMGPNLRKVGALWMGTETGSRGWFPGIEDTASWGFCGSVLRLLHAIMGYYRQPEYAIPGILEVIDSCRRSGNYELELDAIELLTACGPTSARHRFDLSTRYKSICQIANASRSRRSLLQIGAVDFTVEMIMCQ